MAYTKEIRQKVYEKYDGHCAYCGRKIAYKDMQIDHIVPIYRGYEEKFFNGTDFKRGEETIDNYNPSCRICNRQKGTYTVEQYRSSILNQYQWVLNDSRVRHCMNYGLLEPNLHDIKFYFELMEEKR